MITLTDIAKQLRNYAYEIMDAKDIQKDWSELGAAQKATWKEMAHTVVKQFDWEVEGL